MISKFIYLITFIVFNILIANSSFAATGILIVAHGSSMGSQTSLNFNTSNNCQGSNENIWEKRVIHTFNEISAAPKVAKSLIFTMWNTICFEQGISDLKSQLAKTNKKLTKIYIIPLFISSFNTVVDAQKYILGLNSIRPKYVPPYISLEKISFKGKVQYLLSLDSNKVISEILKSKINSLLDKFKLQDKDSELILVFHGPVSNRYNQLLMSHAWNISSQLSKYFNFYNIQPVSLRDDAARAGRDDIWQRAKQNFRTAVKNANIHKKNPIIVPVVISMGGIERGLLKRLEGLNYVWANQALLPDQRLSKYLNQKIIKNVK